MGVVYILAAVVLGIAAFAAFVTAGIALVEGWNGWIAAVCCVLALAGAALTIAFGQQAARTYTRQECDSYASFNPDLPVEYRELSWWSFGCYAQVDGKWIPTSNIRIVVNDE